MQYKQSTRRLKRGSSCVALALFEDDIMTSDTNCLQDCFERYQGKRPMRHVGRPHCVNRYAADDCHAEEGRYNEAIDDIHQGMAADLKTG